MVDHRNTHPSTPQSMQEAYTSMQPLVRHNASTPYKQDGYGSGGTYIHNSGHSTAYGSPASNTWLGNEYYPQELHQDPYHSHNPVSSYVGLLPKSYGSQCVLTDGKGLEWTRSRICLSGPRLYCYRECYSQTC